MIKQCKHCGTFKNLFVNRNHNKTVIYNICKSCRTSNITINNLGKISPMKGKHHTVDARKKISCRLKGTRTGKNNPMYGRTYKKSQQERERISKLHKYKIVTYETREKISNSNIGKKLSVTHKNRISLGNKGKVRSIDASMKTVATRRKNGSYVLSNATKEKLRLANLGKIRTHESIVKGIINRKKYNHKKLFRYKNKSFRSSWEVKVAKWLNENNIKWEYESKNCAHKLKNGRLYIVDFYLPEFDKYLEVKGWWNKESIEKCQDFVNKNGVLSLYIVDKSNINNLNIDEILNPYSNDFVLHWGVA